MSDLYKPRPERLFRFRFSLRTVFVLLTLIAFPLGWLGVQMKWVQDRRAARQWIAEHAPMPSPKPSYTWFVFKPFPWVLKVLGEKPVISITIAAGPDDHEQVERLRKLFPEASVHAINSRAKRP